MRLNTTDHNGTQRHHERVEKWHIKKVGDGERISKSRRQKRARSRSRSRRRSRSQSLGRSTRTAILILQTGGITQGGDADKCGHAHKMPKKNVSRRDRGTEICQLCSLFSDLSPFGEAFFNAETRIQHSQMFP